MTKIFNLKEHSQTDQSEELLTIIKEIVDKLDNLKEDESDNISDFLLSVLESHKDIYILYSVINSQLQLLEEFDKAEQVLKVGIEKFPDRFLLFEDLSNLYISQNRLTEAEKILNDAAGLIPNNETNHKSDWLTSYGELYWAKGEKSKAVEHWRNAIETDPLNYLAISSLALTLDSYEELKSYSEYFNEIFSFIEIQKEKFLEEVGDADFYGEQEEEEIVVLISKFFTEMDEIEKKKLSKMNAAEKREFFSEIEIDFSYTDEDIEENWLDEDDLEEAFDYEIEDSIFDVLPEEDNSYLMFVAPLLNFAGIKNSRLTLLFKKKASLTPIEKYLLQWGIEVVRDIETSYYSKNKKKKKEYLDNAKATAMEIIEDEDKVEEAFGFVIRLIKLQS